MDLSKRNAEKDFGNPITNSGSEPGKFRNHRTRRIRHMIPAPPRSSPPPLSLFHKLLQFALCWRHIEHAPGMHAKPWHCRKKQQLWLEPRKLGLSVCHNRSGWVRVWSRVRRGVKNDRKRPFQNPNIGNGVFNRKLYMSRMRFQSPHSVPITFKPSQSVRFVLHQITHHHSALHCNALFVKNTLLFVEHRPALV